MVYETYYSVLAYYFFYLDKCLQPVSHHAITWSNDDVLPTEYLGTNYDDAIKWKHFPRYWPFVSGIHRSPVDSPK